MCTIFHFKGHINGTYMHFKQSLRVYNYTLRKRDPWKNVSNINFFELKQLIVTVGVYFLFVFLAFRYTQDKFLWFVRLVYGTKYRASIQKLYSFSAMAIIINWWHTHTHTQFLCFILFFHSVMFVKCQFGLMPLFMCAILCRGWNTRQLKKC